MSSQSDLNQLSVEEFTARCRDALIPVSNRFSYFQTSPLSEDDVREYVEEPVAALPVDLAALLPPISIVLVPYLEKLNGKEKGGVTRYAVSFEAPAESRQSPSWQTLADGRATLLFATKDKLVADYHYHFYRAIASLAADCAKADTRNEFYGLLREELRSHVHGEVDQEGWHLKQALIRRQTNLRRETKAFLEYARQALIDTLTLYLHGICCDIDVEPGPRQLPSRFLRKRLALLEDNFGPPEGYAVFPEEVNQIQHAAEGPVSKQ
jgi:hypothetical protein